MKFATVFLIVLCPAIAQADGSIFGPIMRESHAKFCAPPRPQVSCLTYEEDANACIKVALDAQAALSSIRLWRMHGLTTQQAAEMVSRTGYSPFLADAAEVAGKTSMSEEEFAKKAMSQCLADASRK